MSVEATGSCLAERQRATATPCRIAQSTIYNAITGCDMNSNWRKFIMAISPFIGVTLFLFVINIFTAIISGSFFPWFIFPAAAFLIPIFIMFTNMMLKEDDSPEAMAKREAEAAQRNRKAAGASMSSTLQSKVNAARMYQKQINSMAQSSREPLRKSRLNDLSTQVSDWVGSVEAMARQVDDFYRNDVIQNDLKTVPESVRTLTRQLSNEQDPAVRAQIERTMGARASQLKSLQTLQSRIRQSEVQLESTIAHIGTIYSQALAIQSTDQIADYDHLSKEVDEQAKTLRDQLEALEEVKFDKDKQYLAS
jgi:hypothetical protein